MLPEKLRVNAMHGVTVAEIQELVRQLPVDKLTHAYRLLRELAEKPDPASPQVRFMRLPIGDRQRLLAQQATEMGEYYTQTNSERQDWQGGEFQDEY